MDCIVNSKVMNLLSVFSDRLKIDTPTLGKALVRAALLTGDLTKVGQSETLKGSPVFSLNNAEALKLGKANEEDVNKA